MTKVTILPIPADNGDISYHAVAGDKRSSGRTPGEALDSLSTQLSEREKGTLVVIQNPHSDEYFGAEQRERLAELMERWRIARDRGQTLPAGERKELETLVEAELRAASDRSRAILDELAS